MLNLRNQAFNFTLHIMSEESDKINKREGNCNIIVALLSMIRQVLFWIFILK